MFRVLIALGAAYGLGNPSLDGYRPTALDKPLHGFYSDINTVVGHYGHVVKNFDSGRVISFLGRMTKKVTAQLHT